MATRILDSQGNRLHSFDGSQWKECCCGNCCKTYRIAIGGPYNDGAPYDASDYGWDIRTLTFVDSPDGYGWFDSGDTNSFQWCIRLEDSSGNPLPSTATPENAARWILRDTASGYWRGQDAFFGGALICPGDALLGQPVWNAGGTGDGTVAVWLVENTCRPLYAHLGFCQVCEDFTAAPELHVNFFDLMTLVLTFDEFLNPYATAPDGITIGAGSFIATNDNGFSYWYGGYYTYTPPTGSIKKVADLTWTKGMLGYWFDTADIGQQLVNYTVCDRVAMNVQYSVQAQFSTSVFDDGVHGPNDGPLAPERHDILLTNTGGLDVDDSNYFDPCNATTPVSGTITKTIHPTIFSVGQNFTISAQFGANCQQGMGIMTTLLQVQNLGSKPLYVTGVITVTQPNQNPAVQPFGPVVLTCPNQWNPGIVGLYIGGSFDLAFTIHEGLVPNA